MLKKYYLSYMNFKMDLKKLGLGFKIETVEYRFPYPGTQGNSGVWEKSM